jgi:hypothetical protein
MKPLAIAILMSACTINGKAYGPGTKTTASSSTSDSSAANSSSKPSQQPSSDLYTNDGRVREDARYYKEPPYLTAPADPWAAVQGDQPLRWPADKADHWTIRDNEADCTAKQDHCLVKDTWFIVRVSDIERAKKHPGSVSAAVAVFGPEKPAKPWNGQSNVTGDDYIAFRTVPATKKNLVAGALVIGLTRGRPMPKTGRQALEAFWTYGVLEEAKLDLGVYQLKDYPDTLPLEGARVAVLSWRPGENVQIIGGKKRDELAVSANDVFMPEKQ